MNSVPAEVSVQADNDRVRVTRYRFPPNSATGWHTHAHDYVIVPIIGGTLTMIDKAGKCASSIIVAGESYYREAGVSHDVVNQTDTSIEFVEIELK